MSPTTCVPFYFPLSFAYAPPNVQQLCPFSCSVSKPAHLINGQGHDAEEASLALGDSALGAVHERADGLAQRPLAIALEEHLL